VSHYEFWFFADFGLAIAKRIFQLFVEKVDPISSLNSVKTDYAVEGAERGLVSFSVLTTKIFPLP
jgi:hypothetical protein